MATAKQYGTAERPGTSVHIVERVPPSSIDAERGLLGCVLLEAGTLVDRCIEAHVDAEAFFLEAHREIFDTILRMHERRDPIDVLTVIGRLREENKLESVGGEETLFALSEGVATTAHAEYFLQRVFDNALRRRVISTATGIVETCYDTDTDAAQLLSQAEQEILSIGEERPTADRSWAGIVKSEFGVIEQIAREKKGLTGLSTGFVDLDRQTLGMQPSAMIVLAARPSMGKTSLALNIAENVALGARHQPPRAVAVFSLEMSADALARRMLCGYAGVSAFDLARGKVNRDDVPKLSGAADALSKAPIFIDDTPGLEVPELRARARRLKHRSGIGLVVIDYLQLLHYSKFARDGLQRETAAISQGIKEMAKELKIPVLILSQLNRAAETRDAKSGKPMLSDLRDSGAIEQDADVVMLLRRPSRYDNDPEHDDERLAIVDVAKNRNGPIGKVKMDFDGTLTRFADRSEQVSPDGT